MMRIGLRIGAVLVIGLSLLIGCQAPNDIRIERKSVDLAFPIFTSETTISDLIHGGQDSSALMVYPDNRMSLIYESTTHVAYEMPQPDDFSIPMISTHNMTQVPDIQGVTIKKARIEDGKLSFNLTNNQYQEDVLVQVTIPQLVAEDVAFSREMTVAYHGSLPEVTQVHFDLAGYSFDFPEGELAINYSAQLSSGQSIELDEGIASFQEISFEHVIGRWNATTLPVELQPIELDFFDHNGKTGIVQFTNPSIKLFTTNSVGMPIVANLSDIKVSSIQQDVFSLEGSFSNEGMSMSFPAISEIGQTAFTEYVIDVTNSNISDIVASVPKKVSGTMDLITNPTNSQVGFMTKDSYLDIDMRAELPFEGTVNQFSVEKSFGIKLTNEMVQSASIKIESDNSIPMDAAIQLYFLDANGIPLDSLTPDPSVTVIESAEVDHKGSVISDTHTEVELPLSFDQWERIKHADEIILKTIFSTTADATIPVTVLSSQRTQLNAGIKLVVLP